MAYTTSTAMLLNQPLNTNSLSTNKMPTIFAPTIAQSPPTTKQINPFSMRQFWGLFVLLLGTLHVSAQISQVNTPYSKIGIGTLFPTQFAANKAMGGITAAYHSPTNINYDNPASYARIKLTTFETALQFNGSWLAENTLKSRSATGALGYLASFAFPAAKFWTMSSA
ncbi:MAG: hypothetical protein IPL33_07425 [Sphingobacteriales bacterium]|nr:hypothetical protein [Sphingobacteriales bacterium]